MGDSVVKLREFIDSAKRSRKYPENTAMALKSALRLFEPELNEEERASAETFKKNLDRIYRAVFDKNKTKYSSGSLDTYRKRISKLLNDYLAYGIDPAKMNNWSPPVRKVTLRAKRSAQSGKAGPELSSDASYEAQEASSVGARLDWPLANGRKAILILPHDLTGTEAETIKQLVTLRVAPNKDAQHEA